MAFSITSPQPPGPSYFLSDAQGLLGVIDTHSAKALKAGALIIGGSGLYMNNSSLVGGGAVSVSGEETAFEESMQTLCKTFLTLGLGYGIDASLGLPIYYEKTSVLGLASEPLDAGDVAMILKWSFPTNLRFTTLALFLNGSLPTSSKKGALPKKLLYIPSGHRYPDSTVHAMGLTVPGLGTGGALTVDLSELTDGTEALLHLNLEGNRIMSSDTQSPLGMVRISVASEISPFQNFRLETEFRYEMLVATTDDFSNPRAQTATFGLGLGWAVGRSLSIQIGGLLAPPVWNPAIPFSVNQSKGSEVFSYRNYPNVTEYISVAWQGFPIKRDTDHDGIPDATDNCPTIPEDLDGFQDSDGCPDPDNDRDGVPDELDQCPYAAEDFDGFQDRDGCPDVDNDNDGILEGKDACPNDAEDKDGFQDEDGCPDLDNDRDGIPDAVDKCPDQSENFNGIEDQDGCPEEDLDGDRVPDSRDKCPTEKEIYNFYQDEDGCPDERPDPIRDEVLLGVDFQLGTATLVQTAEEVLKKYSIRLLAYPGIKIEIQAYVEDQTGIDAISLTEARAEVVAGALNKFGIEHGRMKHLGLGSTRPLASNKTATGRIKNRRIEIHRIP